MRKVFITAVIVRVVEAPPHLTAEEIKKNVLADLVSFVLPEDKTVSVGLVELPEA
jgi:hypothetical protein